MKQTGNVNVNVIQELKRELGKGWGRISHAFGRLFFCQQKHWLRE